MKAIVFDLDDTLYNFKSLEPDAIKFVFTKMMDMHNVDFEQLDNILIKAKVITKNKIPTLASGHHRLLYFQTMLEILGIRPIPNAFYLNELFWNYILDRMTLNEGVLNVLQYCKKNDIKVGICTDLVADIQYKKIIKLKIAEYIDAIVTSEEVGMEKPNPIMFETIINKLNVSNQEVLFIGDNYQKDICGAKNMGIRALWFTKEKSTTCETISDFKELMGIIHEI